MSTDATHSTMVVRRWRRARWIAPALLLMILVPLIAACGGDSSGPGVATVASTPTATASDEADATPGDTAEPAEPAEPAESSEPAESGQPSELAFSQCMRDNGIANFPDPGPDGDIALDASKLGIPLDSPPFAAADEACKQYLPNGGEQRPLDPETRDAILAYSQCMRDNSITNYPDPDANGGIAIDGNAVDMNSPQFKAAEEICDQRLPDGGEGGSTNESGD